MRLLIWDFDGTLGYRDRGWSGALLEVLTTHGLAQGVLRSDLSTHLKTGFPWHVPEEPREAATADYWWERLEPVFVRAFVGVGVGKGEAVRLASEVRAAYVAAQNWTLYPDTEGALEQLSQRGWRHALLTNHVPELPFILEHLGLQDRFVGIFNSAETGVEKPHAKAFDNVLRALEPQTAWMIGDNPVADTAGAEAAGLPAILVRTRSKGARHVCGNVQAVVSFLEGL